MTERAPLNGALMALLAVSTAVMAAALHYQTPILPELGREFALSKTEVGLIATLLFGGFFCGNLLLVPLGDVMDKKRLIFIKLAGLAAMQATLGLTTSYPVLLAASLLTGICSSVSQDVVSILAGLARPEERGKAVGTVLTGLFLGILFGRIGGGWIADQFGWRWIYALSTVLILVIMAALSRRLPAAPARETMPYGALMRSLLVLYRRRPDVRRASLTQFCIGIGYGGFWATLAPMLALVYGLGPAAAGMMAIPGAAGIFVARPAGRRMDRVGVRPVALVGAALVCSAFLVFAGALWTLAALVVGAILLDCGLRAALVANQALVTGADPNARSRANSLLSTHVWGGNATGAFLASAAFAAWGWIGVCIVGVLGGIGALALQFAAPRDTPKPR
jgi:predicted MFS family arabinose efflux permease